MKLSNVYIICVVLLAFFTQSCSKMNDLHQKYLDEGEIIYAAKVDSVTPRAGNGRIQFEMFIRAQRIETVRIFWNFYADSVDVQVGNQTGVMKKLIENLDEKGYIFQFVSFDKYGHRSLPFEATGSVYGDGFQSTLSNRMITSVTALFNGTITITWSGAVDKGVRCDLTYTNITGAQVTIKAPMSAATTVLTDVDFLVNKDLKYRTLFLPEVTAIDTFYTDFKAIPITEVSIPNGGFETPSISGIVFNPQSNVWTFTGKAGMQTNGSPFGAKPAPEGVQTAFIQSPASLISQTFDFTAGNFAISFKAAQRGTNAQRFEVYFDNTLIGTFQPATANFEYFVSNTFTATAGPHKITIAGTNVSGNSGFIDDVKLLLDLK